MRNIFKKIMAFMLILSIFAGALASCSKPPYDFGDGGEFNPYPYADLSVYMDLPDYKNLTMSQADLDQIMDIEIYNFCYECGIIEETESGTVQKGDSLSIFYVMYYDGQSIEELSWRKYDEYTVPAEIFVGVGELPFEDELIGKECGSSAVIDMKLPDDYPYAQYKGKDVTFVVEIVKIGRAPELTDDICKTYAGYESKDAFIEAMQKSCTFDFLWQALMDKCTLKAYPNTEYTQYYQQYYAVIESFAEESGLSLEDFLSQKGGYYSSYGLWRGMTKADLRTVASDYAKSNVVNDLLVYSIIRAEEIKLVGAEWDAAVSAFEKEMGLTYAQIVSRTSETEAIISVLMIRIADVIMANVTITNE